MYICLVCQKSFKDEEQIKKHFLNCWKEQHPFHKMKPAPRSENIETRKINNEMKNFFNSLKEI